MTFTKIACSKTNEFIIFLKVNVVLKVHSTYANILKNMYKKVRKNVGIG
jgi:hypothetical protein